MHREIETVNCTLQAFTAGYLAYLAARPGTPTYQDMEGEVQAWGDMVMEAASLLDAVVCLCPLSATEPGLNGDGACLPCVQPVG